jgi:hypothetical protein
MFERGTVLLRHLLLSLLLFPADAGANVEDSYGHAIVLVGYNNRNKYWVVRSSWGPKVGKDGYFKVALGASGIADSSNTWGLRFAPLKPTPAYTASQVSPASEKGCYNYKASSDDYFGKVADRFGVSVKQLMLINLESVGDPADSLAGRTIKVCNATEVADVLPPTSQLDALIRIKAAIDPNDALSTWRPNTGGPTRAYCSWQGIRCDSDGNVIWIVLGVDAVGEKARIGGVLPEADLFLALPKLARLAFTRQDLVGTLPESYAKLTKLQLELINLAGNKLRGTLPASWGGMKNLTKLFLGGYDTQGKMQGNMLQGTLPSKWCLMASLRQLGLAFNTFTGTLPPSWGALQLEMLQLNDNELTGSIPNSWTPLITGVMRTFDVKSNRLSGSLQPEW